jgi:hypothetical protein
MPAPTRPAPVSGPGALSRRTDGGPAQKLRALPDAKYGEQATYQQDQRGAPLAQAQGVPSAPPVGVNERANAVVPFSAPTQRPDEPVTAGAAMGPGPGPEALGISPQQVEQQDASGISKNLPFLEYVANLPDSAQGSRMYVNLLKANS